ncbi:MAG: biotin--[Clostridia bacterium]|nr:biotin--[acetyl-CoA-carboxylase] ligase [Clostridia bacterium]
MTKQVNGYKILRFQELNSTNTYAKTLIPSGENALIVAEKQTGGRGTKGRSFSSNAGGIYATKLTVKSNVKAENAFLIMANAAVAVCKTLERFSLSPVIKWANDVYVNDRKIAGVLIENTFSGKEISSSIVGVGLNVNNLLEEELSSIAISMRQALNKKVPFQAVEKVFFEELTSVHTMEEYLSRVGYLNREITLIFGEERVPARAISVTEQGALVVEIAGKIRQLTAAEVSLVV